MKTGYKPFGEQWKAMLMRSDKSSIIAMFKNKCLKSKKQAKQIAGLKELLPLALWNPVITKEQEREIIIILTC